MMKVAIISLLAAPCALAFTPATLAGVWSCRVEVSINNVTPQNFPELTTGIASEAVWDKTSKDTSEERTIVFSDPDDSDNDRRFEGRTYYRAVDVLLKETMTEEHDFHGFMKTANEGVFFLDENAYNEECFTGAVPNAMWTGAVNTAAKVFPNSKENAFLKSLVVDATSPDGYADGTVQYTVDTSTGLPTDNTGAGTQLVNTPAYSTLKPTASSRVANAKEPVILPGQYAGRGSCSKRTEGPWDFVMEDADHFTLTVDSTDMQLDNYFAGGSTMDRVHSMEKCMRGLPLESPMCDRLIRSGIDSTSEKDNACQGTLVCHKKGSGTADNYGCEDFECCAVKPAVAPVFPQVPQYYYPQPQYYQQPYAQYQPFQSNPFQFYGR